jgi:hypothetical protein
LTKRDQSRDRAGDEMVRLTVAEAALKLGISEAGVRKRVQRNQIPHERDDDGSLRVWVSPGEARHAESRDVPEESPEDAETVEEAPEEAGPPPQRRRPGMSSSPSGPAARWRRARCTRGCPRSAGDAKRRSASATACAGSCTLSGGEKKPTRRPRSSRVGAPSPNPPREGTRRAHGGPGPGLGGGASSAGKRTILLDDWGIDITDEALGMLRHMRKQVLGNPAPYVEVRAAAISVGLDPGGSECRALVDELLRAGYLQRYPSSSLTAHGLYRLTDLGIGAADEAALEEARRRWRLDDGRAR